MRTPTHHHPLTRVGVVLLLFTLMQACQKPVGSTAVNWPEVQPPVAKVEAKELAEHGNKRVDNYYWLRDDARKNPDMIAYLTAENTYTDTMTAAAKPLQQKLYDEIVGRIKQDDNSVPVFEDGYWYYTRFEKGKNYPIYCRRKDKMENPEQVLLDCNKEAEGKKFYSGYADVSDDGNMLAIIENTTGDDMYAIRFRDIATGKAVGQSIPQTAGGTWAADNKTFFYNKRDAQTQRVFKVFRHAVGSNPATDAMVYHEADETYGCGVGRTRSKKYLLIQSYSTLTSEVRLLDARNPAGAFRVFAPRTANVLYDVDHHSDYFFVRTNKDGAQNFKIMKVAEGATGMDKWQEVMAHRTDVLVEDINTFKDHLVVSEREKGLTKMRIIKLDGGKLGDGHYIEFQDPAYLTYPAANPTFATTELRYGYTSLTTPNSTYSYDMNSKERKLLKQDEVLGGTFKPENYESKRLWAKAADGAEVPISLVYRKDMKKDKNPLWITGYGSYGSSYNPSFNSARLSLLDRGFIFAIAHIRGGEDMGRQWYLDGKLMKKKNTFTDFIACTEHLQKEGYTTPALTIANGGSAGGLLMGAISNMAPQDYKAIIADVPFVDVITTMMDASIPLTTGEWDEWGNPIKSKEAYDYMLSYSPYDQVKQMEYPHMLVTTSLNDSRVAYWEPAKWVAKLRTMKTDKNVLMLKTNMAGGHGGSSGRYERYKETAFRFAYAMQVLGMLQ